MGSLGLHLCFWHELDLKDLCTLDSSTTWGFIFSLPEKQEGEIDFMISKIPSNLLFYE